LLYRAQSSAFWSIFQAEQREIVQLAQQRAISDLSAIISDVGYLARQESLQQMLNLARPVDRSRLAADYLAFATHKTVYDQVRFIDADGREVVRIDFNNGRPRIVPDAELQEKVDHPYIHEMLRLQAGQLYASTLDLNVERGTVEQPPKPTIRMGAPVFDAEGRKRGIVVVNYLAQPLLERVKTLRSYARGEMWLLNPQGYWLIGPRAEDEWAFMYPQRKDRTAALDYPVAWAQISGNPGQMQFLAPRGFFTSTRVHINDLRGLSTVARTQAARVTAAESWILVAHVPAATLDDETAALRSNYVIASGSMALLLVFVAWFSAQHWTARDQGERAVRGSEARFRGLLDSAPDAIVITDRDGRIIFVNGQSERLFGYRRADMIDRKVEMLVPERYRKDHMLHRDGYINDPKPRQMGGGMDLYGVRRDGTEFPIAISLSSVDTEQGLAVFADIRDVTEQRAAERKLQELNERLGRDNAELESLNKELEAFSYSVSHDLRAPLRAVDGFSQALLEDAGDKLDKTGRQHLTRVRAAAQRMGMLIDDLIKLARVTRTEMNVEPVDLSAIARTVAEELKQSAPSRQVEIEVAPGLNAQGDPRLLRVALENLLGNAWKFTAGRTPARIAFGQEQLDGAPAYFVRDNGVGFDMAYAGKLFGAFQRLHDARDFAGTGIGLATVQRIIHKHGGRIWAESQPDKGATFRFTL
jgi:PAS domain S-box-containing protein